MLRSACAFLVAVTASVAWAEEKIDTVLTGLDNPAGVAVQPETGAVFVADSAAGKVVRVAGDKAEDVIVGSPSDVYGKGPMYNIGPLGLAFFDKNTLVVGDGGYKDGEEFVRVFTLPEAGKTVKYEEPASKLGPLAAEGDIKPEGNLYGVAVSKNAVYVTCNGDDTKGWVARSEINGTKFGDLKRFIATKEAIEIDAPVGITLSPRGEVVVGQMGEINMPKDSQLTFYNANSGKKLMNQATGLYDITALAYSPKGHLYALDFAWMKTDEGGLFRLDAATEGDKQTLKAVKIASLDKPTALAFGKDGELYITLIGTAKEGDAKKPGSLVKLAPGL